MKRTVEMFQWKETKHIENEGEANERVSYTYEKVWSSEIINSYNFNDKRLQNPGSMPVNCNTMINEVNIGDFKLAESQISQLNNYQIYRLTPDIDTRVINDCARALKPLSYGEVRRVDDMIYANPLNFFGERDEFSCIGQIRIKWEYVPCENVSLIAQQVQNLEGVQTFRPYNPERVHVPFGEDNGSPEDATCPITCLCCWIIEKCFKSVFQESVNFIEVGHLTSEDIFEKLHNQNALTSTIFRWLAWFLNVFGHYLLFTPIIKLLSWIPLVGFLLAAVLKFAVAIFALVWASTLHFLVLAVSWMVYRPLYGLLCLSAVGVCIGMLCYSDGKTLTQDQINNLPQ